MSDLLLTMLKEELDWNWIDLNFLKADVVKGYLSPADYQKVTGEDYVAPQTQPAPTQPVQPSTAAKVGD